ncbi:hypothetical protein [Kineococcus glutinatus]|uniref:DUF2971 domain-containing protein n=1 Tax=Kineococcus glutinatus TaxID=1070872 RepID=A0ABP9I0U0_9ACTN
MGEDGGGLLWHYTDLATLMAMTGGEEPGGLGRATGGRAPGDRVPCLWAAHFEYLNDSREFHYARDLLHRALTDLDGDAERRAALHRLRDRLTEPQEIDPAAGPFIVCLSSAEDSLSQWRGYGMSRRSVGCAIGFDERALEGLGAERHRVRYLGDEDGARWIRDNLPYFAQDHAGGRSEEQAEQDLYYDLFGYSAQIKHVSFADEQEERFVWRQDGGHRLWFRTSRFGMTPFVKIPFPRLREAVRRIRVAPTQFTEHARVAVAAWAAQEVGEHVEVLSSDSPFRGW